jgi:hypothetical protein
LNLFDNLPQPEKERQVETWLTPCAIVRLHCPWISKPGDKNKWFLIGAVRHDFLMLMINTDPYRLSMQTQVQLLVANYEDKVLENDCNIDCSTTVTQYTFTDVKLQIMDDGARYRGRLIDADRNQVIAAVKYAVDIPPIQQEMLIDELSEAA